MQPRTTVQEEIKSLIAEYAAHLLEEYKKANNNKAIDNATLIKTESLLDEDVTQDDEKTLLLLKYGALTRIFTEFKKAATVGEFKDALSRQKKYQDIIKSKRNWKGYFVTTQGETFVHNLETLLSHTNPNIPFILSAPVISDSALDPSPSENQPPAPVPGTPPLPIEERATQTVSVTTTVAPPRQDKRNKKVQKDDHDKKPESSRTPSLFEQIINNTQQIFAKLKEDPTTTSNKIVDTLTVEQLDEIDPTLRDLVIKHTTATAAIKEKCFADGKVKPIYFGPLQENKLLIFSFVADAEFDKFNFADTNTVELFALLFTPPAVAFTADSLARLIHKPPFVNQVNLICESNIELAVNLVAQLDATQLSKITKENIQAVLVKPGFNKDKLAKKLYVAGCFDNLIQQDPELLVAVLGMSRATAGAPVCAALFSSHIKWSEENLTQPQLALLANNGFEQAILSNWTLLQRLGKESYTSSQLTILLDAVLADKLNPLLSIEESRLHDNLKHHLQNLVINYETNIHVLKQCFLNAHVRNKLLDFLSPTTLLATFLKDADCLEIFFDPRNRASSLIRASFSYVVNHASITEFSLVRKLINEPEFKDRKFTEAEIKTLLMYNDEAITDFIMENSLAHPVHANDLEIIFKNAHFTRRVIFVGNMDEDKFLDLLIDTREEQVKFVEILLRKPATVQLKGYVSACRLNTKIISHIEEEKLRPLLQDLIVAEPVVVQNRQPIQAPGLTLEKQMSSLKEISVRFSYFYKTGTGKKIKVKDTKSVETISSPTTPPSPYIRLQHYILAFLHPDAHDRKRRPPRAIYTSTASYSDYIKRTDPQKKQEKKQPVHNTLGQFIIEECFKGKHYELLAYFLYHKNKYIPKKDTSRQDTEKFLTSLDNYFLDLLTKSSNEIFFELLSCDSLKSLDLISRNFNVMTQQVMMRVPQLTLAQIKNEKIRQIIRQFISKSEDYFRFMQAIINTSSDANAQELYESAVVNIFVDAANMVDPEKDPQGQKAVKQVLVGALKKGTVTIETVLSQTIYSDMFRKDGETLMQFITTAKQALSVFVHFAQFKAVEFTAEQLERLKALASNVNNASFKPVAIFNHPMIVEAMRKKDVAPPPVVEVVAERTVAQPNKPLPAAPKPAPILQTAATAREAQPEIQLQTTAPTTTAQPALENISADTANKASEQPKTMAPPPPPPPKGPPGPPPPPKGKLATKNPPSSSAPAAKPPAKKPAQQPAADLSAEIAKRQKELAEAKRRKEEAAKLRAENPAVDELPPAPSSSTSVTLPVNSAIKPGFFTLEVKADPDFPRELIELLRKNIAGKITPELRNALKLVKQTYTEKDDTNYKIALSEFYTLLNKASSNTQKSDMTASLANAISTKFASLNGKEKTTTQKNIDPKTALDKLLLELYPSPPPAQVAVNEGKPELGVAEDKHDETIKRQTNVVVVAQTAIDKQEVSSVSPPASPSVLSTAATTPQPTLPENNTLTSPGKPVLSAVRKKNMPSELVLALTRRINKTPLPQEFKDAYDKLKEASESEYDNALQYFNAMLLQASPAPVVLKSAGTGRLSQLSTFNKPQEDDIPGLIAKHCPKPSQKLLPK